MRSREVIGEWGGRQPVILCTHLHGWYLSVRSPSYWLWPWRYRLRLGWDDRRRFRLAGHVEVRRTRPWKWKPRKLWVERYAEVACRVEDSRLVGAWCAARRARAYTGGLSRRRVFGYYYCLRADR